MPPKTWQELTPAEKIEDLRRDVQKLFDVVNALSDDLRRTWNHSQKNEAKLSEVSKGVATLEGRLPKAD